VVVGYMESVKIQFDVRNLVLVHGPRASVLRCAYPRELFRFQRRDTYRVRPLPRSSPLARLRHTDIAGTQLALRVLDVSIGGCALFLPDDVPAMQPGVVMNRVEITLDADTGFRVNLRLQHVTSLGTESRGVRLGCGFVNPDAGTLRGLQRFIDQTQKRSRLLTIPPAATG
jgi:c-di-GMP-binding flagellar brake protein YcgR